MEHNNLGDFSEAVRNLERALNYSKGPQVYELKRISIESRFFDKDEPEPEELIRSLGMLVKEISEQPQSEEVHARRRKIFVTLGNIHHVIGERNRRAGNLKEANHQFQSAQQNFEKASDKDKWARFGLAEAFFRSGNVEAARKMFEEKVLPDAQKESIDRMEPRTRVVGRMTELICFVRIPDLNDRFAQIHGQVLDSLADVDGRLTIYSQIQRRNVTRNEFISDLALLRAEVRTDKPTVKLAAALPQLVPDAMSRESQG